MSITNQQNINQVQILYPVQPVINTATAQVTTPGNNITDAGALVRAAVDGDREAQFKLGSGEGGPDFVCTALTTAADATTFLIPWASLLKLYAAQQAGVTFMVVKAKISSVGATAVANSDYWEIVGAFQDIAGTMTLVSTTVITVSIEGAATADPVLSNSTTNLSLVVTPVGAVAHQIRAEIFTTHIQ